MPSAGFFSPADPGELDVYSLDFVSRLEGEAIGAAAVTLDAEPDGAPNGAAAWLVGPPLIVGTTVSQLIGGAAPGGLPPGAYRLTITVTTAGGRIIPGYAGLSCAAPA